MSHHVEPYTRHRQLSPRRFLPRRMSGQEKQAGARNQAVSLLMLLIGLWLFMAAYVLRYPFSDPGNDAQLTEVFIGLIAFFTGLARLLRPRGRGSDLLMLAAGAWLVAAPFVNTYGNTDLVDEARINDIATGSGLILLSLLSMTLATATPLITREASTAAPAEKREPAPGEARRHQTHG